LVASKVHAFLHAKDFGIVEGGLVEVLQGVSWVCSSVWVQRGRDRRKEAEAGGGGGGGGE
jgi:hypothetical protein